MPFFYLPFPRLQFLAIMIVFIKSAVLRRFFRKKIKIAAKRLKNQRFTAICVYYIIVRVLKTRTVKHFSFRLRLSAYKHRYALLRQVSETVEPPFSVCQVQHHFVNVKAFYLLLLTLYYRVTFGVHHHLFRCQALLAKLLLP